MRGPGADADAHAERHPHRDAGAERDSDTLGIPLAVSDADGECGGIRGGDDGRPGDRGVSAAARRVRERGYIQCTLGGTYADPVHTGVGEMVSDIVTDEYIERTRTVNDGI